MPSRNPNVHACLAVGVALLQLGGCVDASLRSADKGGPSPVDDRFSLAGNFCAEPPSPEEFPVRILFIVDVSQSMNVTDPAPAVCNQVDCLSRRGDAVQDVVNRYPANNGVAYGLITFSSDSAVQTKDAVGLGGFTRLSDEVKTKLPFLNKGFGESNFEGALQSAYEMLQTDMIALNATARSRARYVVVFMSDGLPAPRTDTAGLPEGIREQVTKIKGLQKAQRLADIKLHTVFLSGANTPSAVLLTAKELMAELAREGGGSFRSFDATEALNLLYIDYTSFIRTFAIKRLVVSNSNARTVNRRSEADTDGDGLLDSEELIPGTDPTLADTDGDGFSDLLEVRLHDSGFDPLFPGDADCTLPKDRLDSDGDSLRDCEERFVGTSLLLPDTDADGYPDDIELRFGSNPVQADSLLDIDFDGARNGAEIAAHMNPAVNDSADFSDLAYRYDIKQLPSDPKRPGRSCYEFTVDNISLGATGKVGGKASGINSIMVRAVSSPLDAPDDFGNHLVACARPRFQVGPELKLPPSGRMQLRPTAFKKLTGPTDDPEVFNAERDCVLP